MGRTNVGKSSLFNRLIKKRKSLVIDEKGITRDLLKGSAHWWGEDFEVIDSGGLPDKKDELSLKILEKIELALWGADRVVVMADAKAGLQPEDFEVLKKVRKSGKPFLLFINKLDHPARTNDLTAPFYKLHPEFLSGSVENNYAVDEVVEWILSQKKTLKNRSALTPAETMLEKPKAGNFFLDKRSTEPGHAELDKNKSPIAQRTEKPIHLFVIGRANGGKSLLCNQILSSPRMIVSSQPGTTLDTVTEFFSHNKSHYSISDNPGSRRGSRSKREKISWTKSRSELEKSNIILLVLDAQLKPGRQESRLIELCLAKQKPVLLVLNKTDLLKKEDKKKREEEIKKNFHFYPDLPYVFVSAKTGSHKKKLFQKIESLSEKMAFRVSTSELNKFFSQVIRKAPAPVYGVSDVKFYYLNQTKKQPPEFLAFTNHPKGVTPAYKRFVIKKIKEKWRLEGVPISFHALKK